MNEPTGTVTNTIMWNAPGWPETAVSSRYRVATSSPTTIHAPAWAYRLIEYRVGRWLLRRLRFGFVRLSVTE